MIIKKTLFLLVYLLNLLPSFSQKEGGKARHVNTAVKEKTDTYRDLYADTWVATDALGRTMPGITISGSLKKISSVWSVCFISLGIPIKRQICQALTPVM